MDFSLSEKGERCRGWVTRRQTEIEPNEGRVIRRPLVRRVRPIMQFEPNEEANEGRVIRRPIVRRVMPIVRRVRSTMQFDTNKNTNKGRVIGRITANGLKWVRNNGMATRSLAEMELKCSRSSKVMEKGMKNDLDLSNKRKRKMSSTATTNLSGKQRKLQSGVQTSSDKVDEAFKNLPRTYSNDNLDLLGASTSKKRKRKMSTKKPRNRLQILRSTLKDVRTWKEIVDEENEKLPQGRSAKFQWGSRHFPRLLDFSPPLQLDPWEEIKNTDLSRFFGKTSRLVLNEIDKEMPTVEPIAQLEKKSDLPNGNLDLLEASTSEEIEKEMPTIKPINQPEKPKCILNEAQHMAKDSTDSDSDEGKLLESDDDLAPPDGSLIPLIDFSYKMVKQLRRNRILRSKLQRRKLLESIGDLDPSDEVQHMTEDSTEDSTDSDSDEEVQHLKGSTDSDSDEESLSADLKYHEIEEQFPDVEQSMIKPFPNNSDLHDIESVVSVDDLDSNLDWIDSGREHLPYLTLDYSFKVGNRIVRFRRGKNVKLIEEQDRIAATALFDLLLKVDLSDVDLSFVENSNSDNITLKNVPRIPRFELPCEEEYASWNSHKKKNAEKQVSEFNARIALIELFKDIFTEVKSTESNRNNEFISENHKRKYLCQPEIPKEFSQPKNSDESNLSKSNNLLNLANQNRKNFSKPEISEILSPSLYSDEAVAGSSCMVEEQIPSKCEVDCNVWSDIHSEFWKDFDSEFWIGIHSEINSENQNRKTSSKQEIDKAFSQSKNLDEPELFENNNGLHSANQNRKTLSKPEIAENFSEPKTSDGDVAGFLSAVEERNPNKCKYGCTIFSKEPCFHKKCINYLYEKFPIPEIAEAFLQPKTSHKSDFLDSDNELKSVNQKKKTFSKPEISEEVSQAKHWDDAVAGSSIVVKEKYPNQCEWGCTVLKEVPCFHEKCMMYLTFSKQDTTESFSQANICHESESPESNNKLNSVNPRETLPKPQNNEAFLQPQISDEGVASSSKTIKEKKQDKESKCKFGCTVLNEEPCYHEKWIKYVKENETQLRKEVEERINELKIDSRKNYEKEVIDRFIKSIANVNFSKK